MDKIIILVIFFTPLTKSQDKSTATCKTSASDDARCIMDNSERTSAQEISFLKDIKIDTERIVNAVLNHPTNNFAYDNTKVPRNCRDIQRLGFSDDGIYRIYPFTLDSHVDVYCDMYTDGGGWTVFQRREDGSMNFTQDWNGYHDGFGPLDGEHWLGNKAIHALTADFAQELRIDLGDWEDNRVYAKYGRFNIGSEEEKFTLHVDDYSGSAGDSLRHSDEFQNGMTFSTFDQDNDQHGSDNCANILKSGFWFHSCFRADPNGVYSMSSSITTWRGIIWYTWKGANYGLKFTEMKMRPIR